MKSKAFLKTMRKTVAIITGLLLLLAFAQCKKHNVEEEPSVTNEEVPFEVVEAIVNDSVSNIFNEVYENDNLYDALPVIARRLMLMEEVATAVVRDYDIEVTFTDGSKYTIMFRYRPDEEQKPSSKSPQPEIETKYRIPLSERGKNVLVWEPFCVEFAPHGFLDLVQGMRDAGLNVSVCESNECTIASIDYIFSFDYIIIHTHGGSGGNNFATHEIVTSEKNEEYKDLISDGLVGRGSVHYVDGASEPSIYCINSAYIRNLQGRLNNSIVFGGFCHSMDNGGGGMCEVFHDKGASVFCGFDGSVQSKYDDEIGTALTEHLVYDMMSAGEAYDKVREEHPDRPIYNSEGHIKTHNRFRMDERSNPNAALFGVPSVYTFLTENITYNSALLKGTVITDEYCQSIIERGFCYGTGPGMYYGNVGGDVVIYQGPESNDFSCEVTDLYPDMLYYVRAYAKTTSGLICYGEERSFTTEIEPLPTIQTLPVANITATSAMFRGIITNGEFVLRGFCFGTSPNVTVGSVGCQQISVGGTDLGQYQFTCEELIPNTTYYVKAFARTEHDTFAYGDERSFTTEAEPLPTIQTLPVANVTATSAMFRGIITDGEFVLRGFCFGTSPNVTVGGVGCQQISVGGTDLGQYQFTYEELIPNTTYYVKAFARTEHATFAYGDERRFVTLTIGGDTHESVDLGLPSGTRWATCNVGANSPEEYGDYFAWGETEPKTIYNWSTYLHCMGSLYTFTKYCNDADYGYNGFVDNLITLLPEDDAATSNWGEAWRTPTKAEYQELIDNTTSTWTTQNGVYGRRFTASNGNSIFLPAAGYRFGNDLYSAGSYGDYCSSSLYTDTPTVAWNFFFNSGSYYVDYNDRDFGQSVRAVRSW